MSIDWADARLDHRIRVAQVDPHDLDTERGELTNLILSDCSVSYGYYTDTRVSAQLKTFDTNYIEGSWLRIYHSVGDWEEELGTFVLQDEPSYSWESGAKIYTYDLQSVLWALSEDYCTSHFSIGKGAKALDVFDRICGIVGKTGLHNPGAKNYRYSASKVYEAGESYLQFLFDLCNVSNNRLDVDGHGRITISPYVSPSRTAATWSVDSQDPRTLLLSSQIAWSSSSHEIPSRTIVIYKSGDKEIIGTASRASSSPYSSSKRGYTISKTYSISEMSPATKKAAQSLAQQYLEDADASHELSASFLYFPCRTGDILALTLDGETQNYLIQSIDPVNLKDLTIGTTLKEV